MNENINEQSQKMHDCAHEKRLKREKTLRRLNIISIICICLNLVAIAVAVVLIIRLVCRV